MNFAVPADLVQRLVKRGGNLRPIGQSPVGFATRLPPDGAGETLDLAKLYMERSETARNQQLLQAQNLLARFREKQERIARGIVKKQRGIDTDYVVGATGDYVFETMYGKRAVALEVAREVAETQTLVGSLAAAQGKFPLFLPDQRKVKVGDIGLLDDVRPIEVLDDGNVLLLRDGDPLILSGWKASAARASSPMIVYETSE